VTRQHWTPAQLAEELNISAETVRARCRSKQWPHEEVGDKPLYRFSPEHVEQIKRLIYVPTGELRNPIPGLSRRSQRNLAKRIRRTA
jgi:hypothetical protein